MRVRGAPLIGITAAYGLAIALREDPSDRGLGDASHILAATRPTAVNLAWAIDRVSRRVRGARPEERARLAFVEATAIGEEDVAACRAKPTDNGVAK